jgi:hypothetical protein
MKISNEEIDAMRSALKTDGTYLSPFISDDFLETVLRAALTVRKRLKAERKAAKVACPDRASELVKDRKWDGRMNVWIPWEATATSECPVPKGCMGILSLGGIQTWQEAETLDGRNWSNDTWPIIASYMVTRIKEPSA